MERIKLNLIPSGVAPVVHLSQYDEGRKFGIDLFEGDSVYVLDGTETLTVNSRKPDGHVVVVSVTNTGTSSLEVETVEQLTAVHGTSYAKLKIEKGSVTIATLEFLIAVSRDPLENGDPSESFVQNLQTQISQAVSDQYDSANVVFDPAPTTGHGIGYTVTSEGIKTAIDNAIGGLSIPEDLNDLSDVNITSPTQGEALVWDGTKWVNGTPELDVGDLDDVTITTPSNGDIIVYNNGTWENVANPASTANFAPDYDDTATYNTNDKVIYNNLLYICLEDNITGAWDSTKWQQISTADYNASNLPISANDPTDTKTYIDTGLSGKQDKYWKRISSSFELTGNATGTWSFTDDLAIANYTDILFCISLVSYDSGVRSSMLLSRLGFEAYGVFYDYTIGSDRMYFQLSKATNNSFTVSGTNLGSISSRVFVTAYYR